MTKDKQIEKLFKHCFVFDDFTKQGKAKAFICPNKERCSVKGAEPKWTSYLGSPGTDIMIIAEAPANTRTRKGTYVAGNFADIEKNGKLYIVKEFVEENYKTTPYFTDLIKCGVTRQKNKDDILERRAELCGKYLLLKEIEIIEPKIIFCVGKFAQSYLKNLKKQKVLDKIYPNIQLILLIHWANLAQLHLSPDDKKDIIWKWQAGKLDAGKEPLSKLSYFNKKREIF